MLHHFRGKREVMLSNSWLLPLALCEGPELKACRRINADLLDCSGPDGEVMREVIAHIILSSKERRVWNSLTYGEVRKTEWLLARLAGKEAIRELLVQQGMADQWPADIEILADDNGHPQVTVPGLTDSTWLPVVSLSHSGGNCVALAARLPEHGGVGIDIEVERPLEESFAVTAFGSEELAMLTELAGDDKEQWLFRGWCAREAAVKAMGGGNAQLRITQIDTKNEVMLLEVEKAGTMKKLQAMTFREENMIGAVCILC
jgi:phosphopantetheinyl transferase